MNAFTFAASPTGTRPHQMPLCDERWSKMVIKLNSHLKHRRKVRTLKARNGWVKDSLDASHSLINKSSIIIFSIHDTCDFRKSREFILPFIRSITKKLFILKMTSKVFIHFNLKYLRRWFYWLAIPIIYFWISRILLLGDNYHKRRWSKNGVASFRRNLDKST